MNEKLGLKVLGKIMGWNDDTARKEFEWLRLMARLKYDSYRDFQAGMRFIESLASWLQQFSSGPDRQNAYKFVRRELVYIGLPETQVLVEQFFPQHVEKKLVELVTQSCEVPFYEIFVNPTAIDIFNQLRRKTLFMGLSDGSRIDIVRRSNVGKISNEQIVHATQVDGYKWFDLLSNLRSDVKDPHARFQLVYLLDDFMGTGTSLLRFNPEKKVWGGKLKKFIDSICMATGNSVNDMFEDDWSLCIHHYIGTEDARRAIVQRYDDARDYIKESLKTENVFFSFSVILNEDLPINKRDGELDYFVDLTTRYYDPSIESRHTRVGGVDHLGLGYGGCALPIVLEHNTPNNSIALIWAETCGRGCHAMRPLFRRRQRHA